MSPFSEAQNRSHRSSALRFVSRWASAAFVLCLLAGTGVVVWRAGARANAARVRGAAEARAHGALLERQFSQAATAAEMLGILVKYDRSGLTNFQKAAAELLASHPALASLELQPGGVVSEVVPRAAHERELGLNVLKDANRRGAAEEALTRRVLTVAAPVTLDHGEPGLVASMPVFQRASDGRETFWGFTAATLRLRDTVSGAHLEGLSRLGYQFALLAPSTAQQKNPAIVTQGLSSLRDTVQQPVRAESAVFRLALKPQGGWIDKTRVALESVLVLLVAASVSLLVKLAESRRAVQAELDKLSRQLAQEQGNRTQKAEEHRMALENTAATQAKLESLRLALQTAESKATQLQDRLDASFRAREEATLLSQAELKQAHTMLQQAQETIAQLQTRIDNATLSEKEAASAGDQRFRQAQAATAELQARVEAATRSAREAAEGSAAKIALLEQKNQELEKRILEAAEAQARVPQQVETRVTEETPMLQVSQAALEQEPPVTNPDSAAPSAESPRALPTPPPRAVPQNGAGKPPKRRNARRDGQMDLFGSEPPGVQPTPAAAAPIPERLPSQEASSRSPAEGAESSGHDSADPEPADREVDARHKSGAPASDEKPVAPRRLPPTPPVDPSQLRKAVNQILPLLSDQDPGARDCLKDNRTTFRGAFSPESYVEFEHLVKSGDFNGGLEQLKKAARRHGINV